MTIKLKVNSDIILGHSFLIDFRIRYSVYITAKIQAKPPVIKIPEWENDDREKAFEISYYQVKKDKSAKGHPDCYTKDTGNLPAE